MDVVIYARYSSDKQREESIEGQLRECKAFAERKGYRVIKTYIDRAMSAKTDNRPDFLQMIKDSAKTAFEAVIVWKLDRFARNRFDSAHYKHILRKNGVKVISATENLSDGSESIILESVLEGMAEYYSVDLAEKVTRGMTENALKAKFNGGSIPFGFKISKNGFYQVNAKTAPIVQKIFEMYADSGTITEILQYLKEYGIKNNKGKDFTFNSIRKMLGNRRYLGEYQYKDIVLPDKIPRIISDELYERVQQRMKDNARAPAKHKAIDDYILSTKLICGHCGASMVGESGTAKSGLVYHYYKCATAKRKKSCPKKTVRKVEIEEIVLKKCIEIIFSDDKISKIADEVIKYQKEDNKEIPLLKQEIKETEKSIQNLVKAIEQGAFTKSVKTRLDTLETVLDELKTKLIQAEIAKTLITKEMVVFYFQKFRELDFTKLENKQALVDNLVNRVILYDDRFIIFFNHNEKQATVSLDNINCSDLGTLGSPTMYLANACFTAFASSFLFDFCTCHLFATCF